MRVIRLKFGSAAGQPVAIVADLPKRGEALKPAELLDLAAVLTRAAGACVNYHAAFYAEGEPFQELSVIMDFGESANDNS